MIALSTIHSIAVAVQQQTTLVTADEKLANATAAYLPV